MDRKGQAHHKPKQHQMTSASRLKPRICTLLVSQPFRASLFCIVFISRDAILRTFIRHSYCKLNSLFSQHRPTGLWLLVIWSSQRQPSLFSRPLSSNKDRHLQLLWTINHVDSFLIFNPINLMNLTQSREILYLEYICSSLAMVDYPFFFRRCTVL